MPHTKAHTCNGCCGFRWREDSVRLLVTNATQLTKKKASISFQNNQHVRFIKTRSGQQRVGASCSTDKASEHFFPNQSTRSIAVYQDKFGSAESIGQVAHRTLRCWVMFEQGSFNCGRDREHAQRNGRCCRGGGEKRRIFCAIST
jgi:hypothetical protein